MPLNKEVKLNQLSCISTSNKKFFPVIATILAKVMTKISTFVLETSLT